MSIRLCGVLIVLVAIGCGPARAQDVPKEKAAFTEYVAEQFRREMSGAAVVVKGPLRLAIGGLQANLDRIFGYCSQTTTGCEREISNYVESIAQVSKDRAARPTREAVRVIVRTREYVAAAWAAMPKDELKLQPRELAGGLVMLPAIDMPRTIRSATLADIDVLGLSTDEIFELGLANLRAQLKPLMEVATVAKAGQIGHFSSDIYDSSRLALHESWSPLAKAHGGKLIVAVPATNVVLYIGDDASVAIDAFRLLVKNVWARSANPLWTELLRWTPKRWEVVR
jgi:uncharacterized protein YtpQ (UPF0354 family)